MSMLNNKLGQEFIIAINDRKCFLKMNLVDFSDVSVVDFENVY